MAATAVPLVKDLVQSHDLKSIPSQFAFASDIKGSVSDSLPIIDYSLLASDDADQRSRAILDLGKACEEWGFFVLVNHVIPVTLMKAIIDVSFEYFDLPAEEQRRYESKSVSDPIKSGLGTCNGANQKIIMWRDFLKSYVHPKFHCPENPPHLKDIVSEYAKKCRCVARKLLEGISEHLGLEPRSMDEALNLDSTFQLYAANLYPPCPQPDQAVGIPKHTDHGLFTFLIHNGVAGLQIEHNGEWFHANSPPNSILVSAADQLEIFSNGRYKSVYHRAILNTEATRISVVVANGPDPDAIVGPSAELVRRDGRPLYGSMNYMEYIETQQRSRYGDKAILDRMKIQDSE